ncbi:MAG TPA: GntR family transcriptional regulator [Intrasporangium sp.]|uniref:GntR family transcriptional regulator n=1 Tax=Intrasporangium sp. TaxID=1925024 RepID=UPI002B4701AD|nr:GntR family transcriptional regulator [Intrasporangium sp.]HKX66594.1 GntR family transcriptional regulator [Intrasporangium sp.]
MPLGSLGADASQVPATLHSRISAWLRGQIASGVWPPHYRLKPEPELAAEVGVSRGTLRRALSTLIAEGALVQVRGKGTFVTSTVVEPAIAQKLTSLSEDFADVGAPLSTRVLECAVVQPPRPVAALLDTPARQPILRLERLRSTAAGPVALLANFVRTDLAPGLETVDFEKVTLFGTLASRYGLHIATGRRTFSATAADAPTAELLEVPVGSPLQHLEQVTYLASGSPIEYSDVWIRSDRLRVTSILTRH